MQMSFFSLLTIVFVTLKLTGFIDWSWWLVFLPTIIHVVIGILVVAVAYLLARYKGIRLF